MSIMNQANENEFKYYVYILNKLQIKYLKRF